MPFLLDDPERQVPRWIEYVSGSVRARFLLAPKDAVVVREANQRHFTGPALTRRGRAADPTEAEAAREAWQVAVILGHLRGWDVELAGGGPAPITAETVAQLTDGMRLYLLQALDADDLRDFAAPLPASEPGRNPGATTPA